MFLVFPKAYSEERYSYPWLKPDIFTGIVPETQVTPPVESAMRTALRSEKDPASQYGPIEKALVRVERFDPKIVLRAFSQRQTNSSEPGLKWPSTKV